MPTFEERIAEIERQLGRRLTDDERRLMKLWYEMYDARDQAPDHSNADSAKSGK